MVAPEVAQRLDPERSYGLWYFNEVPVPIPESGIEREIVLRARANIAGNRPASSRLSEKRRNAAQSSIQAGMMTELRFDVSLKDATKPGAFVAALQQLNGNNRVLLTSAAPNLNMGE